jgi:LysR family hydrogen peroxide-inducible transcriptional activator
MDIRQLELFVAAAETGSISRAATRCAIAQPSLSQQIRKLEESLGARLFDRLARGVALTDAGQALLPRARAILAQVRDARDNLSQDITQGRAALAIGAIPTIAPYLLPPALERLRADFPHAAITVREDLTERLLNALVDHEIDAAILAAPIDHDLITLEPLGAEPLLAVLPARHPLASRDRLTPADLRDEPTIILDEMHCLGKQIHDFCAARRLARNTVCTSTQLATVLAFVARGLGVSIVPAMAAANDPDTRPGIKAKSGTRTHQPSRAYVPLHRPTPTREIALARRKDRSPSHLATALASSLRDALAH